MNNLLPSLGLATLLTALCLAGCNSFKSRADEKAAVFDSLSPSTQKRLEKGNINLGDTEDMVYIALGKPDERRGVTNASGDQSVWIYKTYWEEYEGTLWSGWHRRIVPVRGGRGYAVYHEPIERDIYSTHVQEDIRVTFANGAVTSVEQSR